jgi:hypothetical protein
MISVLEAIPVLEMPSSVFRKAMAAKTTPSKMATAAAEMPATTEMATATTEASTMPATEMATATTEASTMPATKASTSSAMAAASSAMSECGGGRNRQNTGQNQTGKETVK